MIRLLAQVSTLTINAELQIASLGPKLKVTLRQLLRRSGVGWNAAQPQSSVLHASGDTNSRDHPIDWFLSRRLPVMMRVHALKLLEPRYGDNVAFYTHNPTIRHLTVSPGF